MTHSQPKTSHSALVTSLTSVPRGGVPLVLASLLEGTLPGAAPASVLIHVSASDREMNQVAEALPFFVPRAQVVRFPAWDCLPYDRVSPRPALMAERVEALSLLASRAPSDDTPLVVLTTASAWLQKVPPASLLRESVRVLAPGKSVNRDALAGFLLQGGYRRAGKAIEPGEFALRGGIVDIVPPGGESGARLDFFGDELESLRAFDPLTQLSHGALERITLHPAGELMMNGEHIARFRATYRETFGAVSREDPLYEAVSAGQHYPGMEHWLPLFFDRLDTLADYVPGARLVLDHEADAAIAERQETIRDYYEARVNALKAKNVAGPSYHPLSPERLYLMEDAARRVLDERAALHLSPFHIPGSRLPVASTSTQPETGNRKPEEILTGREERTYSLAWKETPSLAALRQGADDPFAQLKEFMEGRRTQGKSTLLACLSNGSGERLARLLAEHGIHAYRLERWSDKEALSGKTLGLAVLPLEHGFETETEAVVTEQDWLGERIVRARPKRKKTEAFLAEVANFQEGELVVHREHGIGRFEGLVALEVSGAKHDCLKLVYEDGDKLFLPVENIELVTRFGSEDEGVKLDKLGAASWQARKARMKERIRLAAEQLIKTAAERRVRTAPVLQAPAEQYDAFCARFGYVETEDQARSIEEVLEDLSSGRPMDRLICGDVGFGKTEVALRAAFVVVCHSREGGNPFGEQETPACAGVKYQVAVVTPTTLLARQHYRNFCERFAGFGVTIRQLSRLAPAREQKETRALLAEGKVDIVIGTHALLSKQVTFANLGLLIVDEEQHFGVAQKEKLKELKSGVHVLTLSATPIPRTLQMALSGVRSLSLITTPPVDRLAQRSFIMPWDPLVIREAILREKHRGGRTFVVTPRIRDIGDLKAKLAGLVPEAKVAVAHGQMAASQLDAIMNEFYEGAYDILLSTAIIESGLDIPQANTILVHRADRFGLAQLYQLRGRVGRGKLRAYAYFLLPHQRELTQGATRRLEVMQSLDTLGAGFQLASHDMDIRGFGNLVGEEQSGHIREVGIELYQQMLEEAVAALKEVGRLSSVVGSEERQTTDYKLQTDWSPQINLGLSVLIPEHYVEDLPLRMGLYRRAAHLATPEEIDAFAAELIDRFGTLPEETQHLLETMRLKQLCLSAGIARVDAGPKGAVIAFHRDRFDRPEALLAWLGRNATRLKLRPDQKLILMQEWGDPHQAVPVLIKVIGEIGALRSL